MHTLDPCRINENFVRRTGFRHLTDQGGLQLQCQALADLVTLPISLIVVSPLGGQHHFQQAPQHSVFTQIFHLIDAFENPGVQLGRATVGLAPVDRRIKPLVKELEQGSSDSRVPGDTISDKGLTVAALQLPKVARISPNHLYLLIVHAGRGYQSIKGIIFLAAVPDLLESLFEQCLDARQPASWRGNKRQHKVVNPGSATIMVDFIRMLLNRLGTQVLQNGNHI